MGAIFYSLVVLMQVTALLSTSPPKCKPSDSDCLKSAAQALTPLLAAGMPALGMEPLDIMRVDEIRMDLAGLRLNMTNSSITGLKNAVIDKIKFDMTKQQLVILYHADVELTGQYKAAGRLIILPISGDGDVKIELKNYNSKMSIPFTIVKNKEGKDTMHMKEFKNEFDIKDGAHYSLTNLFNGNKVLSDSMLKFMNENWKLLSTEFGGTLMQKPNKKIFHVIRKYLQNKPIDEILDV
ncbi:circadian clock-controlled protein daywake-like [Cydia pomonella]|uniref:circadian clock-controlled protein daywake-like n=1 Tax=Cydia pomonella TaxID=82600 RepID=UPI002ADE063D|nr:circadian clock-controlled protein daywake-like [Cydia pomonella]